MSKKKKSVPRRPHGTKKGKFKSVFEFNVNEAMPRKKGVKVTYETDAILYSRSRLYIPDFTISLATGAKRYVECKGWFRPEDKMKMEFVIFCNPNLDIRMIFPRKNKRDTSWCDKMGVKYAFASIPKEWLDG